MNPILDNFKKFLLVLAALFIGAQTAYAQCGGKTVNIQLPSDWNKTSIYIYWQGSIRTTAITGTQSGQWSVFTLPTGLQNDAADKQEIVFSSQNTNEWDNPARKIGKNTWNSTTELQNTNSEKFTCSDFNSSGITYIYEDPDNPGRTKISAFPPNTKYFYFLPPPDPELVTATPYFYDFVEGKLTRMELDPDHCGWFRVVFTNTTPSNSVPANPGFIMLSPRNASAAINTATTIKDLQPKDMIGSRGMEEDPVLEWECFNQYYDDNKEKTWDNQVCYPSRFNLSDLFENKYAGASDLFFAPELGEAGWRASVSPISEEDTKSRCTYNFAAIIYDTDALSGGKGNGSFYNEGTGCGIITGIPAKKLVDGKMQWGGSPNDKCTAEGTNPIDGWTETNFINAFKPTANVNAQLCYDMPFKRSMAGLWEFDSNKLCDDGTMDLDGDCNGGKNLMGGYFPPELQGVGGDFDGSGKNQKAQTWVPLDESKISKYCYDRGRRGTGTNCGAAFGVGDFYNGDNPAIWDWGKRVEFGSRVATRKQVDNKYTEAVMNELFCFESAPADFVYERGQEFFFSGDDDIWVFINDSLVIDLGGTHLAAPGYVNLDNLGLTEGESYPIKIFFCDRRTTMSNVRIATNLYFNQENTLVFQNGSQANPTQAMQKPCFTSDGGGSCAAVLGTASSKKCGEEIKDDVIYYLTNRAGDKEPLNMGNEECKMTSSTEMTCYGTIVINIETAEIQIKGKPNTPGTRYLWMTLDETKSADYVGITPKKIATFNNSSSLKVAWGNIVSETNGASLLPAGVTIPSFETSVVAGKRRPVGFAAGMWNDEKTKFTVEEESAGSNLYLNQSSFNGIGLTVSQNKELGKGLRVYTGATGDNEIVDFSKPIEVPQNGLLVLYFTGDFNMEDDALYEINAAGNNDPAYKLKVYQPRMRFVDPANTDNRLPSSETKYSDRTKPCEEPGQTVCPKDKWVYMSKSINMTLAAYDPTSSANESGWEQCGAACDGLKLSYGAPWSVPDLGYKLMNFSGLETKDGGIATISVKGANPVEGDAFAFFRITASSALTDPIFAAQWDSLQFREPPVPYPTNVEIFDRNGDGIGDEVRVTYNKKFYQPNKITGEREFDYPNAIEAEWENGNILTFKYSESYKKNAAGEYAKSDLDVNANKAFWDNVITETTAINADGDEIKVDVITLKSEFSKGIKTAVFAGDVANLVSWATFEEDDGGIADFGFEGSIQDRMPAIVVSAEYERNGSKGCGEASSSPCSDALTVVLSEPVKLDPASEVKSGNNGELVKAFAYRLISAGYENFKVEPTPSLISKVSWRSTGGYAPDATKGDSTVIIQYRAHKGNGDDFSRTPYPLDSIRFLPTGGQEHFIVDLANNAPNPAEIGVRIEGKKPLVVDKIVISELDPNDDKLKDVLDDIFGDNTCNSDNECVKVDDLFTQDKPIMLMPSPADWDAKETEGRYQGSIGVIYGPGISSAVGAISAAEGIEIGPEHVIIKAKSIYHTNLGNYVVKSNPKSKDGIIEVRCNDPLFSIEGNLSCMTDKDGKPADASVYMAWDMKDPKGRWVGTGAYVQVYDFWWEIEAPRKDGSMYKSGAMDKYSKIEMFGVKRTKAKK